MLDTFFNRDRVRKVDYVGPRYFQCFKLLSLVNRIKIYYIITFVDSKVCIRIEIVVF